MPKRRRLPAPPLVLAPVLGRSPRAGTEALKLLRLARFLSHRRLLTDGGEANLKEGLEGRGGTVSLTLQDVRAWAHGLAMEILESNASEEEWEGLAEAYFTRYDRGKPRRPTHLQRLYLEWSRDLTWTGLLEACRRHPRLWPEIELALERLDDPSEDKVLLGVALECRKSGDFHPWRWSCRTTPHTDAMFSLISVLAPAAWRVPRLAEMCGGNSPYALIRACHCTYREALDLRGTGYNREALEQRALVFLNQEFYEAGFLCAFRSFVTRENTVNSLLHAIAPDDPVRRVAFGPRPGKNWLRLLESELRYLASVGVDFSVR